MASTTFVKFNLGPYTVSFDTGIVDDYAVNKLESVSHDLIYRNSEGKPIKCIIYTAIVTNEAKNDGVYVQLWKYDSFMSAGEKRKLYEESSLSIPKQGNWITNTHPHQIAGMDGIVVLFTPLDKIDINLGEYARAKLRDDHVHAGSYWPDEKKLGPVLSKFSVWASFISTYPWNGGAENILNSFEVRSTD